MLPTNFASTTLNFTDDSTGPSGGSVDATGLGGTGGRYSTSTTLSISLAKGTDSGSGLATTGAQLLRASALLSSSNGIAAGSCGSYGGYAQVGSNDPSSPYTDNAAGGITTGHCYRYEYVVSDNVGNTTTYTSPDVMVDTTGPSAPSLSLSSATGNTYINGTTAYINAQAGKSGSFQASATSTDNDSGLLKVNFPSPTGFSSGGGDSNSSPYQTTYNWSGAVAASGSQTTTAYNNANLTNTNTFTITPDTTAPTGGALTVNGTNATGAGSTSYNSSGNWTIGTISDYTDSGSGLTSSTLTRQSATLSSSNGIAAGSCGSFGSATTIGSRATPIAQALTGPTCYLYTLTGLDNVGNTVTITTTVMVDTTGPSAPSLSLSSATGNTYINGTTAYINAQAGKSGSFQAAATSTDNDSGLLKVNFPSPTGFSSGGGDSNSSPYQTTYNWSGAVAASGSQTTTAYNNANLTNTNTFTITPDTTAPTGGALTVNGTNATGAGSTSYNSSGSWTIGTISDYTDSGSGLTSSTLTRQSATLSSSNGIAAGSCGSFGSATTIGSRATPLAQALTGPTCYLLHAHRPRQRRQHRHHHHHRHGRHDRPVGAVAEPVERDRQHLHQRHDRLHQRPGRQVGQLPGRSHQHRQRLRPAQGQLPQPHRLLQRRRRQQQLPLPDHLQLVRRRRSLRLTNNHRLQQRQPHQHQHLHHHTRHNRPHRRRPHRQRHQRNRRRLHQHHEQSGLHDRDADELHGRIRVRACVEHADGSVRDAHEQQQLWCRRVRRAVHIADDDCRDDQPGDHGGLLLPLHADRDRQRRQRGEREHAREGSVRRHRLDGDQQRPHLHVHGHHRCHVHRERDRERRNVDREGDADRREPRRREQHDRKHDHRDAGDRRPGRRAPRPR